MPILKFKKSTNLLCSLLFLAADLTMGSPPQTGSEPLYRLKVAHEHNVLRGLYVNIPVTLEALTEVDSALELDLKLQIDPNLLEVRDLVPTDSSALIWSDFRYRYVGPSGCRGDCPLTTIEVQGRVRFRQGSASAALSSATYELFVLRGSVVGGNNVVCLVSRVSWYWESCRDNVLKVGQPFRRLLSREVTDPLAFCPVDDTTIGYPTTFGVKDDCPPQSDLRTERVVDFLHGGMDIVCNDSANPDPQGDLDFDGLEFEAADYELYKNYFLQGVSVFGNTDPPRIPDSDVNHDKRSLTVSDLLFMGHIIHPTQLTCPPRQTPKVYFDYSQDGHVSLASSDTVGAVCLKVAGDRIPDLLQPAAAIFSSVINDTTRILIIGQEPHTAAQLLSGPLLRFASDDLPVDSRCVLETQASTVSGYYMAAYPTRATAPKDTCSVADSEQPLYNLQIGTYRNAIQGTWLDIPVTLTPGPMSGDLIDIDLQLQVDPSAFILKNIFRGDTDNLSWEQFTVDYTTAEHCIADCPPSQAHVTGRIRLKAPALPSGAICGSIRLLTLYGKTSNDRTLECQFLPIRWLWESCRDNVLRVGQSNCRLISRRVADFWTEQWLQDSTVGYPTLLGAQGNCPPHADARLVRGVDFVHGGIDVVCVGGIEPRGDINLNGVANEISDYVLYEDYFLTGPSAFEDMIQARISTSELNGDGRTLTVADLVYLGRIIVGDALPLPRHDLRIVPLTLLDGEYLLVHFPDTVAVLYLKIAGGHVPELLFDSAIIKARVSFDTTRILIYGPMTSTMLLRFPPRGSRLLLSDFLEIQGSSPEGYYLEGRLDVATGVDQSEPGAAPRSYRLDQNYPNPFNASTRIRFALPRATYVDLRIYNIEGQLVRQLSVGMMPAGEHSITWLGTDQDGNAVPSGVYFYRLTAGAFTESRKMLLIK